MALDTPRSRGIRMDAYKQLAVARQSLVRLFKLVLSIDFWAAVSLTAFALGSEIRKLCDQFGNEMRYEPEQVSAFIESGTIQRWVSTAEKRTFQLSVATDSTSVWRYGGRSPIKTSIIDRIATRDSLLV